MSAELAPKPASQLSYEPLSRRSYTRLSQASSWEEIWEAGPYYQRLSELLENAQEFAALVGWQIDSRLPLPSPDRPFETLKEKILRITREKPGFRFYILMWDHAYFYMAERQLWQGRIWDEIDPRVHFIFDNRHPFGGSHHEKLCLIDGRVALCGGIDLCNERWDSPNHLHQDPRRSLDQQHETHGPYHDLAVQVSGPICQEIHRHIAYRWKQISSVPFPKAPERRNAPSESTGHPVYFSRTFARIDPGGDPSRVTTREIQFLYRDLIRSARKRIILEGQYFWSKEINDLLITQMELHQRQRRSGGGPPLEIVLVLADLRKTKSLTRIMAPYELSLLERLEKSAHATGTKLVFGCPISMPSPDSARSAGKIRPVYVHSKVLVIDDRYLSIGSANFASRALRLDTEVNLTLEGRSLADRLHIRRFSRELLRHWNVPLDGLSENPRASVALRRIKPGLLLREYRSRHPWRIPLNPAETWIHWPSFFDPALSWLAPIKRWKVGMGKLRLPGVLCAFLLVSLILAALVPSWALGVGAKSSGWIYAVSILLHLAWILPIPFLALSLGTAFLIGPTNGAALAIYAFWSCAIWGYSWARMYPLSAQQISKKKGRSPYFKIVRERRFSSLLAVLFDPRLGIRSKILIQGVSCVYLPWYALGTLILYPSFLYCLIWASSALLAWAELGFSGLQIG